MQYSFKSYNVPLTFYIIIILYLHRAWRYQPCITILQKMKLSMGRVSDCLSVYLISGSWLSPMCHRHLKYDLLCRPTPPQCSVRNPCMEYLLLCCEDHKKGQWYSFLSQKHLIKKSYTCSWICFEFYYLLNWYFYSE